MSEVKLSKRAEKIWEWVRCHPALDAGSSKSRNNTGSRLGGRDDSLALAIRQQTLADLLGCSRRSIYRALKQLKEQGYLVETKKRENRCKIYQCHPVPRIESGASFDTGSRTGSRVCARNDVRSFELCPQAKFHLDNCRNIFRYNFPESFDWEKHFPEATHK
ncbi:MAG: HTH domain-containing protein, partial [Deltaproteobacteria bacterium]|nr:HTH domain-containing protein [Deltaproteobacteria bacterium]